MKNLLLLVAGMCLLIASVTAQPIGPGGGPGGGGPPEGYVALNGSNDWWVKEVVSGTTLVHSRWMANGQVQSNTTVVPWPPNLIQAARNQTPYDLDCWTKADGSTHYYFKWHGQGPPPGELRLLMWSGVGTNANLPSFSSSLSTGIGIPIVAASPGNGERAGDVVVLRKVKIGANGEGDLEITQKAHITVTGPNGICSVSCPDISKIWDARDATITSIFGGWPNTKEFSHLETTLFYHSQDAWPYYPNREFRKLDWPVYGPIPTPLLYPHDATDYAEWHLGLPTGYQEIFSTGEIDALTNRVFHEATLISHVVAPVVGDIFRWAVQSNGWRANDPVGPYQSPREGPYQGVPVDTFAQPTAYIAAKQFRVLNAPQLAGRRNDVGEMDTASFKWTWAQNTIVADSKRDIYLHHNSELTGIESQTWLDFRVGAGWGGLTIDFDNNPSINDIEGYVDPGVEECDLGGVENLMDKIGAVLSAGGPGAAVLAATGALAAGAEITAFAAAEAIGAAIALLPYEDGATEVSFSKLFSPQCDAIEIIGEKFDVDTNGDGNPDVFDVKGADYTNPALLNGLKSAIYQSGTSQLFYWKPKVRKIQNVKYQVWEKWGKQGFVGMEVVPKAKELGISTGYFRFSLISVTLEPEDE